MREFLTQPPRLTFVVAQEEELADIQFQAFLFGIAIETTTERTGIHTVNVESESWEPSVSSEDKLPSLDQSITI
jgi:hypothetical protein